MLQHLRMGRRPVQRRLPLLNTPTAKRRQPMAPRCGPRARGPHRRRSGFPLRFLTVLIALSAALSAAGCSVLGNLIPDRPWRPSYVVNRDGQYYFGSRCDQSLVEIGVFSKWPSASPESPAYFDSAQWHAIARGGVHEFALLATIQPGAVITTQDNSLSTSDNLYIAARTSDGRLVSTGGGPLQLGNNMVGSGAGQMTWDEFMKLPTSDFGC